MKYLYKNSAAEQYYLFLDGGLREIPSAAFQKIWKTRPLGNVVEFVLAEPPLPLLDDPLPESAELFRATSDIEVWLADEIDGHRVKRHVVNENQLYDMFQTFDNVTVEVDGSEVTKLPIGPVLSTDPTEFAIASLSGSTYFGYNISALLNGGFVAVWTSMADNKGQSDVFMRRYDGRCMPLDSETKLNSADRALAQPGPRVSGLSDGSFIVVWTSVDSQSVAQVVSQRFDANGQAIGSAVALSNSTAGVSGAWVTALADSGEGSCVVVMGDNNARVYNGLKKTYGDAFSIAMQSLPGQSFGFSIADVCAHGNLGFAVAYQDAPENFDTPSYSVYVRQFEVRMASSTGRPAGNGFLVNTDHSKTGGVGDSATIPVIWSDDHANLRVVWSGNGSSGDRDAIYLRSVDRWNKLSSDVTTVNGTGAKFLFSNSPAVSGSIDGEFAVAWCAHTTGRAETNRITIRYQRYKEEGGNASADGDNAAATRSDVNSSEPRVLYLAGGRFLITWVAVVGSTQLIKARVFATG